MTMNRWPLHPKPSKYQLLYQWVEHLAKTYGISYLRFCVTVLGLTQEEINQLATILPEKALVILSNGTGVPIENLRKRNLHNTMRMMCDDLELFVKTHPEELVHFSKKSSING